MNMGCRIIRGHEMLKWAVRKGLVSPYQFGRINGRMAISCILLKQTSYNIIRLMQLTAIIFHNEAKAAYDRMIPSQCMTLSARAWVSLSAIQMKLTILERMKYFVKMTYRALQDYFQNTFLWKVYGMLQGSSEVCLMWSLSCLVQFKFLDEQVPMAVLPSPWPAIYTACNGKGFLDDVTLWETLLTSELREVLAQMQEHKCKPKPKHENKVSMLLEEPSTYSRQSSLLSVGTTKGMAWPLWGLLIKTPTLLSIWPKAMPELGWHQLHMLKSLPATEH
jgi:hypothetical protein